MHLHCFLSHYSLSGCRPAPRRAIGMCRNARPPPPDHATCRACADCLPKQCSFPTTQPRPPSQPPGLGRLYPQPHIPRQASHTPSSASPPTCAAPRAKHRPTTSYTKRVKREGERRERRGEEAGEGREGEEVLGPLAYWMVVGGGEPDERCRDGRVRCSIAWLLCKSRFGILAPGSRSGCGPDRNRDRKDRSGGG